MPPAVRCLGKFKQFIIAAIKDKTLLKIKVIKKSLASIG
jgi:hypothetical protein